MTSGNLYVSQVGFQPGAVALGLNVARLHLDATRALLFVTAGTSGYAERLRAYSGSLLVGIEECRPLDDAWMADLIEQYAGQVPDATVYLDISPGLNFVLARLLRRLSSRLPLRPIYTDEHSVWDLEQGSQCQYPARDLGIDNLLRLHELDQTHESISGSRMQGVDIFDGDRRVVFRFDEAYEHAGRLQGLLRNIQSKEEARDLLARLRDTQRSHGLRPQVVAVCRSKADAYRLRAAGVRTYWGDLEHPVQGERIQQWLKPWREKRPDEPGDTIPRDEDTQVSLGIPVAGSGGRGPGLVVCLGNDPSATLVALCSHAPETAVILYDRHTPDVVARARRLWTMAHELPVGRLHFTPTDHLGSGIADIDLSQYFDKGPTLANVTPGTKAQTWALTRLKDVQLCSLDAQQRQVRWVEPERQNEAVSDVTYQIPPTLVQAAVVGGPLTTTEYPPEAIEQQREFLHLMARLITRKATGTGHFRLRNIRDGDTQANIRRANGAIEVSVSVGQQSQKGRLKGRRDEGFWLEPVAGGAFRAAGARDVASGVRWKHLFNLPIPKDAEMDSDELFRTDIDVVFQWQGWFVALSAKTGIRRPQQGESEEGILDTIRQEIRAEARACLGRFCIHALVLPVPRWQATLEQVQETWYDAGVLEIPLCKLGDSAFLQQSLEFVRQELSTTREE